MGNKLTRDAETIARIIAGTGTDDRGILFGAIASQLREKTQFYTATLLYRVAAEYDSPRARMANTADCTQRGGGDRGKAS